MQKTDVNKKKKEKEIEHKHTTKTNNTKTGQNKIERIGNVIYLILFQVHVLQIGSLLRFDYLCIPFLLILAVVIQILIITTTPRW